MKVFDIKKLTPNGGKLSGMIFENKYLKIPLQLIYSIEISLQEFEFEGNKIETTIVLDFIKMKIVKLEDLQFRTFKFPVNPNDGYIDGSIYLMNVHNPFDVTEIEFGKLVNNTIEAKIQYQIDFEFEATSYKKAELNQLVANLKLEKLRVDNEYVSESNRTMTTRKLLESFISSQNIGEPIPETDNQLFYIKTNID